MTNAATANKATEILCRFDPSTAKPVVFVTNRMDGNNIEAWTGGDAVMMPLSYYHTTQPLSAKDEKILRDRYAAHVNDAHVQIRHRLPRTARAVPDRLPATKKAAAPAPTPASNVVPIASASSTPAVNVDPALLEVAEAAKALRAAQERLAAAEAKLMAAPAAPAPVVEAPVAAPEAETITKAKRRSPRKAAAKKTAAKKGGSRKPAAKPIDAQPAPAPGPVASTPTPEPTIDFAALVLALAEKAGIEVPTV